MTDVELQELVAFSHRVATHYAGRYDPEYCSLAHTALLRALRTHDERRKVPFRAWLVFLVKRALQYHWRRNRRYKLMVSTFFDDLPATTDSGDSAAWAALQKLSDFDRAIAIDYWLTGLTVRELAAKYDCSAKKLGKYLGKLRGRLWALREDLN